MILVQLRRALEPEEMGETTCGLCGAHFVAGSVLADVVTIPSRVSIGSACPTSSAVLAR